MKRVLSIVLVLMIMSLGVFAEGKPLNLDTSSVEDGAKDVDLMPEIKLVFTNNVVNMKVKDNNLAKIDLLDSDNNKVAITVEMADDQVTPDLKREVIVKTKSELQAGEAYTLIVQKGFMSKTGSEISEDITIGFFTAGGTDSNTIYIIGGIVVVIIALWFIVRRRNG